MQCLVLSLLGGAQDVMLSIVSFPLKEHLTKMILSLDQRDLGTTSTSNDKPRHLYKHP